MTVTEPEPTAPVTSRIRLRAWDAVLAVAIGVVVLFAPLAWFAAGRLPVAPEPTLPPAAPVGATADVRLLPVGMTPGSPPRSAEDVRPELVALLGADGAERFLAGTYRDESYSYPELERAVGEGLPVDALTNLGAKLLWLENGPAALVLLHRAAAEHGCDPETNLLLLLAAETRSNAPAVRGQAARATRACPGDPTPGWLLAQFESQHDPVQGTKAFRALERRYPGVAAIWSGSGDAYLRRAYVEPGTRTFTRRALFAQALARYRHATALGGGAELAPGYARAYAGLGDTRRAATAARDAVVHTPQERAFHQQLVEALEAARRFADAAVAARRLASLSASSAPAVGLFPSPGAANDSLSYRLGDTAAWGLLSYGAGRLRPLSVQLRQPLIGAAGDNIQDLSFIPRFRRDGAVRTERNCPEWTAWRDDLAAGQAYKVYVNVPAKLRGCFAEPAGIKQIAALELGSRGGLDLYELGVDEQRNVDQEARQNFWRWAGDLRHAEHAARQWSHERPEHTLPLTRLGEIQFLRGAYHSAAHTFGVAARLARNDRDGDTFDDEFLDDEESDAPPKLADPGRPELLVKQGAALLAADRRDEAMRVLREAEATGSGTWSYYALEQLGNAERETGSLRAAADNYATARSLLHGPEQNLPVRPEALAVNSAVVAIRLGQPRQGLARALDAVHADRRNPIFLMTAGYAAEQSKRDGLAIRLNRRALGADPSTFPAANDLGVLLARRGDYDAAVAALRRAVGANPRYALGWFNLGVALGHTGFTHVFAAQGALARAFSLDERLRDRERVPTIDAGTYRAQLDVSRPLPPEWSFAAVQKQAPEKTAGIIATLLLALTLGRSLAGAASGRPLAETWLGTIARIRFPGFLRHPAFAVIVTLAVLLYPLLRDPGGGRSAAVAGLVALLVPIALVLRARRIVARVPVNHESWTPGMLLGIGTAFGGLTWTPLPVLKETVPARAHWAGPVALAALAVPLVLSTAFLGIPLTRSLATATLIMAACLLTPVKPIDGGSINTAVGLSGAALALLVVFGLL